MFKRIIAAAAVVLAAAATGAWAGPLTAEGVENRLIVGLKKGVSIEDGRRLAAARGLEVLREIPQLGLLLVQSKPGFSAQAVVDLKSDARVAEVARDVWTKWIEEAPASFQGLSVPAVEEVLKDLPRLNAPSRPRAAGAEVQWGVQRVNAPAAWAAGDQGAGAKVCVIDTGIDADVPDLQGQVVDGQNFIDQSAPWKDDHFHGTHVAGIVAAKQDGKGVVGVAPQAKLFAAKVLTKEGKGDLFAIIQGVQWCQGKADVINMSLGAPQSLPFLEDALNEAMRAGVAVIAAAGNGDGKGGPSPVNFPGAYKGVIAVSALDDHDGITKWSSRGPEVGFIAPGLKIPSTVPASNDASYIHAYSGTSMASPHVAGLAALAVARGAKGQDAVRAALTSAATKLPTLSPNEQGAGLVDAALLAR